jgi:hypothetical protein
VPARANRSNAGGVVPMVGPPMDHGTLTSTLWCAPDRIRTDAGPGMRLNRRGDAFILELRVEKKTTSAVNTPGDPGVAEPAPAGC